MVEQSGKVWFIWDWYGRTIGKWCQEPWNKGGLNQEKCWLRTGYGGWEDWNADFMGISWWFLMILWWLKQETWCYNGDTMGLSLELEKPNGYSIGKRRIFSDIFTKSMVYDTNWIVMTVTGRDVTGLMVRLRGIILKWPNISAFSGWSIIIEPYSWGLWSGIMRYMR